PPPTPPPSPLSLHDALPISLRETPRACSPAAARALYTACLRTAIRNLSRPANPLQLRMDSGSSEIPEIGGGPTPCAVLASASEADRKSTRLNSSHLGISYAV